MSVEQRIAAQDITFGDALRIIRRDKTRFSTVLGGNGGKVTKSEMYKKLFSHKARYGSTKIVSGKEEHIPGYYEMYRSLSNDDMDRILAKHIIDLANARILMFQEQLLNAALTKAESNAAQSTKA